MRKVLALTLFAFVFAGYMLMYSRVLDIGADEGTILAVTESIAKYGHTGIDQANNVQYIHPAAIGRDSQRYSKYGLGQSLAALPLYAIGLAVPAVGLVDVALLLNPLVGALSAVALLLAALELGASSRRALILALIYAFCTFAWVYAKNFYGEALEALGFAVACWGMAILLTRRQVRGAVLAGAGIGLAMLVRSTAAIAAPVLLFVIWQYVTEARRWRLVLAAAIPIATPRPRSRPPGSSSTRPATGPRATCGASRVTRARDYPRRAREGFRRPLPNSPSPRKGRTYTIR